MASHRLVGVMSRATKVVVMAMVRKGKANPNRISRVLVWHLVASKVW